MRTKLLFPIAAVAIGVVGFGSYYAGFVEGKSAMDKFCGNLIGGVSASVQVDSLLVISQALNDLRDSKSTEAEAKLARLAKFQAEAVAECAQTPECKALAGKPLPTAAELAKFGFTK